MLYSLYKRKILKMSDLMLFIEQSELHIKKEQFGDTTNLLLGEYNSSRKYQKYIQQQETLNSEIYRRGADLGNVCKAIRTSLNLPAPKYPDITIEFAAFQNDVDYLYGTVASALIDNKVGDDVLRAFLDKKFDLATPMLLVNLV